MCLTINGWGGFWLGLAVFLIFCEFFSLLKYALQVRGIKHICKALANNKEMREALGVKLEEMLDEKD